MASPVQTPNAATTTKPDRSSTRIARKAPLRWLPWVALLLLALVIAGVVVAIVAVNSSNSDSSTSSSTAAQQHAPQVTLVARG